MATVGLMTVSDGRRAVHDGIAGFALGVEDRIARALGEQGHAVVRAESLVWTNELAVSEARRLADARPDLTIISIPVWAFPHFTMLAARETHGPLLLFSTVDPQYPGMVGMLAAGGALDQIGRVHGRAWGEIDDPAVRARVEAQPARRRGGQRPAGHDLRPDRRAPDGHVHGGLEHGRVDAALRRRRRGDRPVGARPALRARRPAPRARVASGSSATRRACTTTASS